MYYIKATERLVSEWGVSVCVHGVGLERYCLDCSMHAVEVHALALKKERETIEAAAENGGENSI